MYVCLHSNQWQDYYVCEYDCRRRYSVFAPMIVRINHQYNQSAVSVLNTVCFTVVGLNQIDSIQLQGVCLPCVVSSFFPVTSCAPCCLYNVLTVLSIAAMHLTHCDGRFGIMIWSMDHMMSHVTIAGL